jgi:regulator of sirC expression with transglutaminase-like and TPR domain
MSGRIDFAVPTPLAYFATLVAEDGSLSLIEAAISIAQDEHPDLDIGAVLAEIDAMADKLRRRVPTDAGAMQRLRLLNRYFYSELGFAGNVNDYYDSDNSYLHAVLRSRRGIPITLAVLYIELAAQIDLPVRGVCFPGHFLVKLRMDAGDSRGEVVIDPFTGQSLSREELDELLAPYKRSQGLTDDYDIPLGLFLQAASARDIVARVLRNLKEIHAAAADWPRLMAIHDRLVVLLPETWDERRDRGLTRAEMGRHAEAMDDLSTYLAHRPDAGDAAAVRARIASLRAQHGPRLH